MSNFFANLANPLSGKWELTKDFVSYPHASAKFYKLGIHSNIAVFHYKDVSGTSEFPADNSDG